MDPAEDIIDVLYRYRGSPPPAAAVPPQHPPRRHPHSRHDTYQPAPGLVTTGPAPGPNQTHSCHTTPRPDQLWDREPRPARSHSNTPLVPSHVVTGRVGYNNTPVVARRQVAGAECGPGRQLTRSTSAYSYHQHGAAHHPRPSPRTRTHQDLIHSDDELTRDTYGYAGYNNNYNSNYNAEYSGYNSYSSYRGDTEVVTLPSGARQRIPRPATAGSLGPGAMPGLRQRRPQRGGGAANQDDTQSNGQAAPAPVSREAQLVWGDLASAASTIAGSLVMLVLAYQWSRYLHTLHENDLWFSEIMEVEREISFRTEQGLYYSYFKQLVRAPSLAEGLDQLRADNMTESGHAINILERFNVYQEVVLAAIYKFYDFRQPPILFYVYAVFCLQGVYLCCLYLLAWSLTGSWLAGVLTTAMVATSRFDVTRVTFTVPLREHFSLPFIFLHYLLAGRHLRAPAPAPATLLGLYVSGVLFTVSWQFAQFVLLIQALVLFVLGTVGLLDRDRVCQVLLVSLAVMLSVWWLQYYQVMVVTSLVVSLVPVTLLSLQSQADTAPGRAQGLLANTGVAAVRIIVAFSITLCLNIILKVWMNQTADNHIFKFVKNKFVHDSTDFETKLYLCNEAFTWLDWETYRRMSRSLALPLYAGFSLVMVLSYSLLTLARWRVAVSASTQEKEQEQEARAQVLTRTDSRATMYQSTASTASSAAQQAPGTGSWYLDTLAARPDLCYHTAHSLALGLLAASTLRMKCFWAPYICVLGATALADTTLWAALLSKISGAYNRATVNLVRHIAVACLVIVLFSKQKPIYDQEMSDLREFYDPDTVDLMQWLEQQTARESVVSGSMQLMAGVKLCSGRAVTNHPHFEDQQLRDRTKELYQVYAKTAPGEVHAILKKYKANYVVLEDSICLAHRERCGLPDIMDLANGHIPDDGIKSPDHLVPSKHPRFCVMVRYDEGEYRQYFKKVFENRTFRIYQVL